MLYEYSNDGINFQSSGSFNNLDLGSFTFTVRDANGCLASSEAFEVVLGVINPDVAIYPNPASGILNVEGLDFDHIILMDLIGRELLRTETSRFDIQSLDQGIYILRIFKSGAVKHEQRLMIN